MTGITRAVALQHLSQWLAADLAVSTGQSYTIGDRTLTRVDAQTIADMIDYWRGIAASVDDDTGTVRRRSVRVTPIDL